MMPPSSSDPAAPRRRRPNSSGLPDWLPSAYLDALSSSEGELEPDLIFFGEARARRENLEFDDADYWLRGERPDAWWIFGESGQGDHWLLHTDSQVYFFDHDQGQRSAARFAFVVESLTQWLEIANVLESSDRSSDRIVRDALERISPGLADRYPFALA